LMANLLQMAHRSLMGISSCDRELQYISKAPSAQKCKGD
jgi:hypothetical protein